MLSAQTEKNFWLLSGSASIKLVEDKFVNNTTGTSQTWKEFYVDTDFKTGRFILNDFSCGLSLFTAWRSGNTSGGDIYYNGLMVSIGPDLRYYFFKKWNKLLPFIDANYQTGRQILFFKNNYPTQYAKLRRAHLLGGLEYLLNPTVGLDCSFGYKHTFLSYDSEPFEPLMVQNGFFWKLGITLHLIKKN